MNLELQRLLGFKKEVDLILNGRCPMCKNAIDLFDFTKAICIKEYHISGLCEKCQDIIFAKPDEEI